MVDDLGRITQAQENPPVGKQLPKGSGCEYGVLQVEVGREPGS